MSALMVSTAEQLDMLPVGSVVMEGKEGEPQRWLGIPVMPGVFHRFPGGWHVVSGLGPRDPAEVEFPATVLYRARRTDS